MDSSQQPNSSEVDSQVGQAWSQHFLGQNDVAIRTFQQLVERWPDHIDAHYGLALSLKKTEQKAEAGDAFRKTKSLVENAILDQTEMNPRLLMLSRMIDQQLAML
ncbi:MAG: tetratricopeptide repeat protein [Chloroflexota bacterium]